MSAPAFLSEQAQYFLADQTSAFQSALAEWSANGGERIHRLWARDASLWTTADEARWLGWLDIVERLQAAPEAMLRLAAELREASVRHVVVLGMGGSSLCPDVLRATFGQQPAWPALSIIDSMVPGQVAAALAPLELDQTVFIVASKSGSTIEPNVLKQYCWAQVEQRVGPERVGQHFVAITDPNTKMEEVAKRDGFRRIIFGDPTIGGRYSALSPFGMTAAAAMGLDLRSLLARAAAMVQACREPNAGQNPGVALGLAMGVLWRAGRDKLTVMASPGVGLLGAWLEQLIAESTGKQDRGIVPVDDEPATLLANYGADRAFCYVRLTDGPDPAQDTRAAELRQAGHPVIVVPVAQRANLGAEFFRWEIATAVAGAVLGINPFDQPDVEAAKIAARSVTAQYEATGSLPSETPRASQDGLTLYVPESYAPRLAPGAAPATLLGWLAAHLATLGPGDYFAINAFLEMNAGHQERLQRIRARVLSHKKVATTLGYGPRFLHSTGQLHKGGPNRGVFLQLAGGDPQDLAIPGQKFSFGVLKTAQAQGDYAVLAERGRRIVRIDLGPDTLAGLDRLDRLIEAALS